jgi:regulator of protease activity HflC (stomatin/prohibitin superfamily)
MSQQVNSKSVLVIGLAALVLMTLMGSWYTVDETERGVLLRNGALVKVVEPGLSFKVPFIETVKFISVQSNATTYQGLQAYSKDQQSGPDRTDQSRALGRQAAYHHAAQWRLTVY